MARRLLANREPKRLHNRTREPGAEYVYKQCLKMWEQRGWAGDGSPINMGAYRQFERGLIVFSCMKGQDNNSHLFTVSVEAGIFSVKKIGADYVWTGKFGLPKIPSDEEMVEIKLAI